ncbi:hypothetical protein D1818_23490 [Aquimarina sp. BL5]|uniref:hypothetical protein n=1 Tax=Aquimarina sp. BL5 TaxID=1714860 RepID=UPI000E47DB12|nr:hypothetical protein [Aquimarina sp. BL5]AXT53643.1 hypothetical protein D1818_23490 [Aquimarina sp. BL5]RKN05035.1 hypothetical protein D7036_11255 [Aquimarina sp. BL5]
MKKGVLSILISTIGFFFVYKYNTLLHEIYYNVIVGKEIQFVFINDLVSFKKLFKIVLVCISLLSFYLGIISFLKKSKIGLAGMAVAIVLCITAFIPFWKYTIEDSGLDILIN